MASDKVRLTTLSKTSGWAAKVGPGDLDEALSGMDIPVDPNVLAGIGGSEDAGVYRLSDDAALIQTVDFFTPIVDDPRIFGMAAAANALSDVYAMGGRPITALNVVCYPLAKLGIESLKSVLAGGLEILREAQVALVGGHSVEDDEPKYGLCVSGLVHPDRIMRNSSLRPGDKIILTKAVGTGVIATAIKGGLASSGSVNAMVTSMCTTNRRASEVAARFGVQACTDVTGFGLAGHLVEMARASGCRVRVRSEAVPLLAGAAEVASMGLVPAGAHANRNFFGCWTDMDADLNDVTTDLMFDPQTSGGLLLAIPSERVEDLMRTLIAERVESSAVIGEVLEIEPGGRLQIV